MGQIPRNPSQADKPSREIELKLELDATQEIAIRRSPALKSLSSGTAKTRSLWSVYYDTQDQDLRMLGIALRLRRAGGEWIQTLKYATSSMQHGLSTPVEIEYPVPSQKVDLTRIPDDDLRERLIGIARKGLHAVTETRFRRTSRLLALEDGETEIEFVIDKGTLGLEEAAVPFIEAEFELRKGNAAGLYACAGQVVTSGPIRFSQRSKSERAIATRDGALASPLRKARPLDLTEAANVEEAAVMILGEGLAHMAPNLALVLDSDDPNGPHQLRVGLRRLRSALSAFRPVLGRPSLQAIGARAQVLASEAGRIRDLDVLDADIVAPAIDMDRAEQGYRHLLAAIRDRRELVRSSVRKALAIRENAVFPLELAGFLASRGWLDGTDATQTSRLAQPVRPFACKVLDKRWKAVRRWGDRIEALTIDERHEMRKEVKKLRYMVDAFRSLMNPDDVALFMRQIKRLQKAFGALNDSAMAEMVLMAPDAPGLDDPLAQRAAGRIIGRLQAQSDALWPSAIADWRELSATGRFWNG